MNQHEKSDRQVIIAQLICFLLASILGFSADLFSDKYGPVIYKFVDATFITGMILVAMKLAREGWDMPAAGFTLLSIAWGIFFLAKDFQRQDVNLDILGSTFYFLLPSMILIAFYDRFPLFIRIISLVTIIPSLIGLIYNKTGITSEDYEVWRKISYQSVHIASIFWAFYFYRVWRRT